MVTGIRARSIWAKNRHHFHDDNRLFCFLFFLGMVGKQKQYEYTYELPSRFHQEMRISCLGEGHTLVNTYLPTADVGVPGADCKIWCCVLVCDRETSHKTVINRREMPPKAAC